MLVIKLGVGLSRLLLVSKHREFELLQRGRNIPCAVFSLFDLLQTLRDHFKLCVAKELFERRDEIGCVLHLNFCIKVSEAESGLCLQAC